MRIIKKIFYDLLILKILILILFIVLTFLSIILKIFRIDLLGLNFNKQRSYWKIKKNYNKTK